MNKRILSVLWLFALIAPACSSSEVEPDNECGPNGECPSGYVCSPVDRRCVISSGGGPDAGTVQPDAPPPIEEEEACPAPQHGPTIHTGDLRADETWSADGSPHIVNSPVRVLDGKTLTIEPCAQVVLAKDALLMAGFGNTPAKIVARGTEKRPITIGQKTAGERWSDLEAWYPGTIDLAYVTLEGGGADRFRRGASITGLGDSQAPTKPVLKLDHVTVKGSAGMGILLERLATFDPASNAITVTGSTAINSGEGEALRLDAAAMGDVPAGSYTGNALDAITVYGAPIETAGIVLDVTGVPYRMADGTGLTIRNAGTLELLAGVELQIAKGQALNVLNGGRLVTSGTAASPVKIGARPADTTDRFVHIEVDYPATLSLTHTVLEGGGDDRFTSHALLVARGDSQLPLKKILHVDDVSVRSASGTGILVERFAAFDDTSRALEIRGSGATEPTLGQPLRVSVPAVNTIPDGRYAGNAIDEIVVDTSHTIAETADETFHDRGVPYAPTGSLNVRPASQQMTARLTIDPGVTIKFPVGLFGIIIGAGATGSAPWPGELIAEGTTERPIVLTSADPAPAAGDWRGVYFLGYNPTGSKMANVTVEYAGASCLCSVGGCAGPEEAGVMFFTYPLDEAVIRNSSFRHIAGHGIYSNFRSDAQNLNMTLDNAFEDVSGCEQTMIVAANGTCARQCM